MKEKKYVSPEMELSVFAEEIVRTSGGQIDPSYGGGENELPGVSIFG